MYTEAYENLANAVVLQAVADYRASWKKGRAGAAERRQVREFFRSRMFSNITEVEPEYLIRKLEEEHK